MRAENKSQLGWLSSLWLLTVCWVISPGLSAISCGQLPVQVESVTLNASSTITQPVSFEDQSKLFSQGNGGSLSIWGWLTLEKEITSSQPMSILFVEIIKNANGSPIFPNIYQSLYVITYHPNIGSPEKSFFRVAYPRSNENSQEEVA